MPFIVVNRSLKEDKKIRIALITIVIVVVVGILALVIYYFAGEKDDDKGGQRPSTFAPVGRASGQRPSTFAPVGQATVGFASINANTAVSLYQQWHEGDGTYYGDQGEGSCQISSTDLPPAARNADFLAALNVEQYMSSAACGMCFRVQGREGKGGDPIQGDFVVFVKDLCPICKAGDMDLAAKGDGRWDIRIQAVQCPVRDTYIQYWLQGSNAWYIKLQVRNTRVPCKEVEVQTKSGDWKELKLTRDGHWAGSARLNLAGDVPVRLTSITGATVQDIIPRLENQVVMEGKLRVQFPLESALPNA